MPDEQRVIVACPKCGQKLRCVAGGVGTCPKCGTNVDFPDARPVIDIPDESASNVSAPPSKSGNTKNLDKKRNSESRYMRIGCLFILICALIVSVSIWGISLMSNDSRDGDRCTICGDDAVYTTSSGDGLCLTHLWDMFTYDDRHAN